MLTEDFIHELEAPAAPRYTEEQYFVMEEAADYKHEFYDGAITAVPGASEPHEDRSMALTLLIGNHVKGKPCKVFKSDMKLRVEHRGKVIHYYPDVMVVCETSPEEDIFKTRPRLIIEVLSRDEKKDLIEKYFVYQSIESLEEYAVVSQTPERPEVHVFRRSNDWATEVHSDGTVTLNSIGLSFEVADLYQ